MAIQRFAADNVTYILAGDRYQVAFSDFPLSPLVETSYKNNKNTVLLYINIVIKRKTQTL